MATTGTATPDISSLSYLQRPAKRMSITDLSDPQERELEMQFNPAELNESLSVNWARLHSPGLSHERLQYGNTDNMKWSFQLIYDELAFTGTKLGGTALASADARNFLMSLCYPRKGSLTVNDGAAPRALFVWPNFITVSAVISSLKFKHSRFNFSGQPTYFTVDVALEEMRDTRLFAEDVAAFGTQRASDPTVKVWIVAVSLDRPILYVTAMPEGGVKTPIDFTERIVSFEFTDELKKAEKLCLRVDNRDLSFWDDPTWRKGTIISATWGYPGHSTTRFLVVQSLKGGDTLNIEADGLSMLMHKNRKVRTFESMTLTQIATRIAADYGSVFGVPDGTIAGNIKVDGDVPMTRHQAAETDATFLTRHARRRGLEFYVDSQGLHFKPMNVSQAPVKELVWYAGEGELLDYSVENDIRGRAGAVTKKGFDPLLKKVISNRSDNDSTKRDGTAPVIEIIDARTGDGTLQTRAAEEHVGHSSEDTAVGVKAHADGAFRQTQLHTLELSFKAVGDPDIVARRVLKFSGLGKRISGLYATTQVRHSIDNSGYVISGRAKSNGTGGYGQKNAASKAAVNTRSPKNGTRSVEVIDPRTGDPHIEFRKSDDEKQQ